MEIPDQERMDGRTREARVICSRDNTAPAQTLRLLCHATTSIRQTRASCQGVNWLNPGRQPPLSPLAIALGARQGLLDGLSTKMISASTVLCLGESRPCSQRGSTHRSATSRCIYWRPGLMSFRISRGHPCVRYHRAMRQEPRRRCLSVENLRNALSPVKPELRSHFHRPHSHFLCCWMASKSSQGCVNSANVQVKWYN